MTLFDVLSFDERIIVYSSEEDRVIYTWNQSLTLQCWTDLTTGPAGEWRELDHARTLSEKPASYDEARQAAIAWHTV